MTLRVNGGIINSQTLTGSLRFFKVTANATEFRWTISDGTVNLPISAGGGPGVAEYFEIGADRPVPNSAAEIALREISKQADIAIIGMDDTYASTTILYLAIPATSIGWGSDTPAYDLAPAAADATPAACAAAMQVAIRALPDATVYITAGAVPPLNKQAPISDTVSFLLVTVVEVPFMLV